MNSTKTLSVFPLYRKSARSMVAAGEGVTGAVRLFSTADEVECAIRFGMPLLPRLGWAPPEESKKCPDPVRREIGKHP